MRVLMIDPWCSIGTNLYYYSIGLASGISKKADLTLVCQHNCCLPDSEKFGIKMLAFFFRFSEKMKRNKLRSVVRGLEYILTYIKIVLFTYNQDYDVIHIEWPLLYKVDYFFWSILKKRTKALSVKVHNVLPHASGKQYVEDMRKLYELADVIPIHGNNIRFEFNEIFPDLSDRLIVQKYGMHSYHDLSYKAELIDKKYQDIISDHKRIYLFCGMIHEDKGLDRLLDIWSKTMTNNTNSLLIVCGRINPSYSSIKELIARSNKLSNILFVTEYVPDNLLNYFFSKCQLVLLPYRKGYMSAVVFTCAEFGKTFLATNFGAIDEYAENGNDSFICENDDISLEKAFVKIDQCVDDATLVAMGQKLNTNFENKYNWDEIGSSLVSDFAKFLKNKQHQEVSNGK